MAYNGWLLQIGDYLVPQDKFLKADSYSCYMAVQDLDSYRDANGDLHREALNHVACKIEFETPARLTNTEFAEFMGNIRRNYIVAKERKFLGTFYLPEFDTYVTQEMYMADPQPSIYGTYGGKIHYNSIKFSLIAYGSSI
jgi:hypothetical protein